MSGPQLPVEIYIEILKSLPCSRSEPSEPTLVHCLLANSVLSAAALASIVWRAPYRSRYTHCVEENEQKRGDTLGGDWRLLYLERRRLDREALELLAEIRKERSGRHEKARVFTQTLSFDVWDALRLESQVEIPGWFTDAPTPADTVIAKSVRDALPRRYWAQTVLGIIARYEVMGMWARAFINPTDVTFEQALAGLSAFFDVSVREVTLQLDEIYASCLDSLREDDVAVFPSEARYDFWELCNKIRDAIHQLGFRLAEGPHFYNLMNQFPHAFLNPHRRETIPMSLVYIFVAVARRLGIQAYPANFPGVVQAHIQPPDPLEPPRLLDMRGKDPPIVFASSSQPHTPGQPTPFAHPLIDDCTRPAPPDKMLARAYNNIIMFMRYERLYAGNRALPWSPEAHEAAYYASSCSMLFETQSAQFMPSVPDSKPLDAVAVLVDAMGPALHPVPRAMLEGHCYGMMELDEEDAKSATRRSLYPSVRYFVGLVFRHATQDYVGCVYGWNPTCGETEDWMRTRQVDGLSSGRNQPFYYVLTEDGEARYVEQENLHPIPPSKAFLPSLLNSRSTFGRYFVDVELDEATDLGRLLPSKELQDAYPEDDAYAASWIHGWD